MNNSDSSKLGFRVTTANDPISREALQPTADYILSRTKVRPVLGMICGSGLGSLASLVQEPTILPYNTIPNFPVSTAPGHSGRLVLGHLAGVPVVLMQGRLHLYEGYPLWMCTLPVRIMKLLGVKMMIVSNAVGGLNPSYKVGDLMLVRDHINFLGLAGESPLRGPNDVNFGPRFFSVNDLYEEKWRNIAREAAEQVGIGPTVHEGVLTMSGGPNYESVAELKMFSILGVDCVGMSSIPECLTAHHAGISVLAFCLVTNQCHVDVITHTSAPPNHQEVLDAAAMKENDLRKFIAVLIEKLSPQLQN